MTATVDKASLLGQTLDGADMNFIDGSGGTNKLLGTATIQNGVAQYPTIALVAGTHTLIAQNTATKTVSSAQSNSAISEA